MKGELLVAEWLSTPWAMRRDVLSAQARVIAGWLNKGGVGAGEQLLAMDDEDDRPRVPVFEARRREANARVGGTGIAVVPVFGTIVQRAGMMTEWCGGSSTNQVSAAIRQALADDTVSQILMEFDTPGGSVYGVSELGDEIAQAAKSKPVIGIANSLSASAGYWLGSQCNEFYVTPGGEVGSIGVYMAHEDWSRALEESGITTTFVSAGKHKTEGNPYQPLDDEAKAFLQSRVNDYYSAFTRAVARGRNVSVDQVRGGMGEGRVLGAQQALAEKMVDGVMTIDQVVRNMQRTSAKPAAPAAGRNALAASQRRLKLAQLEN